MVGAGTGCDRHLHVLVAVFARPVCLDRPGVRGASLQGRGLDEPPPGGCRVSGLGTSSTTATLTSPIPRPWTEPQLLLALRPVSHRSRPTKRLTDPERCHDYGGCSKGLLAEDT
jgi:hypothetical protein